jgi:hypothetical protein
LHHVMIAVTAIALALGTTACNNDAGTGQGSYATSSESTSDGASSPSEISSGTPDTAAASAFTAYAEGGRPEVPWADIVTFRIAGEQVARFDPDFANRRETWEGCPTGMTTHEGRDCPVSPLRTIAQIGRDGGGVVYRTEPPRVVGCNRYGPSLDEVDEAVTTAWIRPEERHRDCFSDFAVAVSLDGAGRVVAVDLTLSGP